jgi:hypothetical protein
MRALLSFRSLGGVDGVPQGAVDHGRGEGYEVEVGLFVLDEIPCYKGAESVLGMEGHVREGSVPACSANFLLAW